MSDEKPKPTPTGKDGVPEQPIHEDEGADGLGYTARPTDHEPEARRPRRREAAMPRGSNAMREPDSTSTSSDNLEEHGEPAKKEPRSRGADREQGACARAGESRTGSRTSTEDISSGRRGGLRSGSDRPRAAAPATSSTPRPRRKGIPGALHDEQGAARGRPWTGMAEPAGRHSARRLVENEEIAEALNRRLEERIDEVRAEDDEDRDAPVMFFCECSDRDCRGRIALTPARFDEIHRGPGLYVVLRGHEVEAVEETIVDETAGYAVVRKNIVP